MRGYRDSGEGSGRSLRDGLSPSVEPVPVSPAHAASIPSADVIAEIIGHLGAAVSQSLPTDDQIIMEHVRAAHDLARLLGKAAADCPSEIKAKNGELYPLLLEACRRIRDEKAPAYHDCIDGGEPECAWCAVFNALDTAESTTLKDDAQLSSGKSS